MTALGEFAVVPVARTDLAHPAPVSEGPFYAGSSAAGAPVVLETSIGDRNSILVRGAQVPQSIQQSQPWLETGLSASPEQSGFYARQTDGNIAVGALRFHFNELERRILAATLVSGVSLIPDALLGTKVVVASNRPQETMQALLDAGLPRVIAASVQKADNTLARSA